MKIKYLKIILLFSFLLITFPSYHVILPNAIIILLIFLDYLYEFSFSVELLMLILSLLSVILIMSNKKFLNLTGVLFQITYLFIVIKKTDFQNILFLITLLIYNIFSIMFIIKVSKKV